MHFVLSILVWPFTTPTSVLSRSTRVSILNLVFQSPLLLQWNAFCKLNVFLWIKCFLFKRRLLLHLLNYLFQFSSRWLTFINCRLVRTGATKCNYEISFWLRIINNVMLLCALMVKIMWRISGNMMLLWALVINLRLRIGNNVILLCVLEQRKYEQHNAATFTSVTLFRWSVLVWRGCHYVIDWLTSRVMIDVAFELLCYDWFCLCVVDANGLNCIEAGIELSSACLRKTTSWPRNCTRSWPRIRRFKTRWRQTFSSRWVNKFVTDELWDYNQLRLIIGYYRTLTLTTDVLNVGLLWPKTSSKRL